MQWAALFLLLYSVTLSLAPIARLHTWQTSYLWMHWIGYLVWLAGAVFANRQLTRHLPDRDPFLFPIIALLCGWGLLTIWRLNPQMGIRQTIWAALALVGLGVGARYSILLSFSRRYKYIWLVGGLLLTALTFVFGTYPGGQGPQLWLGCCGVYLQPSEPLKLLLIVYLAGYLAEQPTLSSGLMQLIMPTVVLIAGALGLLAGQRDLGTASLVIMLYATILFIAWNRRRILVISFLALAAAGALGYGMFDVVRIRVDAWLNPWLDPSGRSYQIVQSLLAVAAGGMLGRGPGLGSPGLVPVAVSDFIYTAIIEETGLLGGVALLLCFALLVARGFRTALCATNRYGRFLAAGVSAYIAVQAILIIGGNLRLLPLTGVTLPFVSYGGSSLVTSFLGILLVLLVSNRADDDPAPLPQLRPYLLISAVLMTGLFAMALATGYWATLRRDALLARTDNPRRSIADRYVPRGDIFDRNAALLATTIGSPGELTRSYTHLPLSTTIGYISPLYGLGGLEAGYDPILRGLQGQSLWKIWINDLLYGQPPPGLDVRLSIDLTLQQQADAALAGRRGALVLLNAETGEILAMASHPYSDPSALDTTWDALIQNPDAPLVNRATQGLYPPGAALSPYLLAYANARGLQVAIPAQLLYTANGQTWACADPPEQIDQTAGLISGGCPAPLATLREAVGREGMINLLASLGFYEQPALQLETAVPASPSTLPAVLGEEPSSALTVTPLQMAIATAALTNGGTRTSPILANATESFDGTWSILPTGVTQTTLLAGGATATIEQLAAPGLTFWQTVAVARQGDQVVTWYLAGTLPELQGAKLAVAVLLEEDNPELAKSIGQRLFLK